MTFSPKLITNLRRILLGLACLATLLALFVVEENWRGDRAWAAFQRDDRVRHPRPAIKAVPDDRNLFKTPLLASILGLHQGPEAKRFLLKAGLDSFHVLLPTRYGTVYSGNTLDFAGIRQELREAGRFTGPDSPEPARDILTAMEPLRPVLDELRHAARERPEAAIDPAPDSLDPPLHSSEPLAHLIMALTTRACAELVVGETEDAYADTYAVARLATALCTARQVTMINVLIGSVAYRYAIVGAVVGIHRHAWNQRQLAELQGVFQELEPLNHLADAFLNTRDIAHRLLEITPFPPEVKPTPPFWHFHGWIQQNKVTLARLYETALLPVISTNPARVFPDREEHSRQVLSDLKDSHSPYQWLSQFCFSEARVIGGIARSAMSLRAVATLCALERHRLAHGHYPDSLAALVPDFVSEIPRDIFTDQPLRFESPASGPRQLFSAGLDGRDDRSATEEIQIKGDDVSVLLPAVP